MNRRFPALSGPLSETATQWGTPDSRRAVFGSLEYYHPDDDENPNPGRGTIEVYDPRLQGGRLATAVAGDMLHQLGGTDRRGKPNNAQWHALKTRLIKSLTPEQLAIDRSAYQQDQFYEPDRSFDDWMHDSRADAYIRGYITPDQDNDWKDAYTPGQRQILEAMRKMLTQPRQGVLDEIGSRGIWGEQRYQEGGTVGAGRLRGAKAAADNLLEYHIMLRKLNELATRQVQRERPRGPR